MFRAAIVKNQFRALALETPVMHASIKEQSHILTQQPWERNTWHWSCHCTEKVRNSCYKLTLKVMNPWISLRNLQNLLSFGGIAYFEFSNRFIHDVIKFLRWKCTNWLWKWDEKWWIHGSHWRICKMSSPLERLLTLTLGKYLPVMS